VLKHIIPRERQLRRVVYRLAPRGYGAFEPTLVRKGQTRFTAFDDQTLSLYALGMSTRNIASMFQEMYGAEISHSLISKVTEAVLKDVHARQSRSLDEV
jgi:putative transposase